MNFEERMNGELRGVEEYIIVEPDERLHVPWAEADFETTQATLNRMIDMTTFGARDGRSLAGLSSVQVLLPGRAVTAVDFYHTGRVTGFINPEVVEESGTRSLGIEGCFSLPHLWYRVERPDWVVVRHDTSFGPMRTKLSGQTARFCLHEIDHINGILISDIGVLRENVA